MINHLTEIKKIKFLDIKWALMNFWVAMNVFHIVYL